MMHFVNTINVLINQVNCTGNTFIINLFLKSSARLARPINPFKRSEKF